MATAEYNVGCCIGYKGHDTSASAAFAFRTIAALDGVVDILSWWTFTDVRAICMQDICHVGSTEMI